MKNIFLSFLLQHRMKFKSFFSSSRNKARDVKITRVAAIQDEFRTFKSAKDFYKHVHEVVLQAKNEGAQLICFPQGMNLELNPISYKRMNSLQKKKIFEVYTSIFKDISCLEEVYIEESSVNEGIFMGRIWTPQGEMMSKKMVECDEKKIYVSQFDSDFDEEFDLGASVYLFPRFGNVGHRERTISKAWMLAQQDYVFSVESKLVGNYSNKKLIGRSALYAPLELTKLGDGILAISNSSDEGEVVVADVNFDALNELKWMSKLSDYERVLF